MKLIFIWLLRITYISLLLLPILYPVIREEVENNYLLIERWIIPNNLSEEQKEAIKAEVIDINTSIDWHEIDFSESNIEILDNILGLIGKSNTSVVLAIPLNYWGKTASKFIEELQKLPQYKSGRVSFYNINRTSNLNDFMVLNQVHTPLTAFVNEDISINLEIVGYVNKSGTYPIKIIIRGANSLIATYDDFIELNTAGYFQKNIQKTISLRTASSVVLGVEVQGGLFTIPYSISHSSIKIMHPDTTILHVAFSPDWTLRRIRQKLKYWPGATLLSFYILRDYNSDNSVSPSEMSLIQFPAEQLFNEGLPGYHGIVAQNFPFDDFLSPGQVNNIFEYIEDGGRLLTLSGPKSFSSIFSTSPGLSPCVNNPEFKTDQNIAFMANSDSNLFLSDKLKKAINSLTATAMYSGCILKPDSYVIAKTVTGEPVIVARKIGKGFVLSILVADWNIRTPLESDYNTVGINYILEEKFESLAVFEEWFIRFLQRREGLSLRAPTVLGPRLFVEDKFIPVVSDGEVVSSSENFYISNVNNKEKILAKQVYFSNLNMLALKLENGLNYNDNNNASGEEGLYIEILEEKEGDGKTLVMPVWDKKYKNFEDINNPFIVQNVNMFDSNINREPFKRATLGFVDKPFAEVYSYIYGVILLLLAIDMLFTRILFRKVKEE